MTEPTASVSVIIPVYNAEPYLDECLRSVLGQSHQALQVIVIDDGSTDDSARILRDHSSVDPRLTVISQPNRGVSAARNAGLAAATGEWVIFVDADDRFDHDLVVESVIDVARAAGSVDAVLFAAVGEGRLRHGDGRARPADPGLLADMVVDESLNAPWAKAYRRDLIEQHHCRFPVGVRMGEDLLFNIDYFRHIESLVCLDLPGYCYRRDNAGSATHRYQAHKYRDLMVVNDALTKWAVDSGDSRLQDAANYIRVKNILSCIRDLHHRDCDLSPRQKRAVVRTYKVADPVLTASDLGLRERAVSSGYSALGVPLLLLLTRLHQVTR